MKRKLFIVEGLPGSGKSTTATNITNFLRTKGIAVDLWHENSLDNPVGYLWVMDEIIQSIEKSTLEDYPFESWLNIERKDSSATVLESRLLQNLSLMCMLRGGSEKEALALPQKVLKTVEVFELKLIFLATKDPVSHLNRIIPPRKMSHPNWIPFVTQIFDPQPFLTSRNLSGEEGYIATLNSWEQLQVKIVKQLDCRKLFLQDAFRDWKTSTKTILDFCIE